jgi:hypothetical protein
MRSLAFVAACIVAIIASPILLGIYIHRKLNDWYFGVPDRRR